MRRSCLLFAVVAMLVATPTARAGGGDHRDGHGHKHGHGSRSAIVPTGFAGAPLLTTLQDYLQFKHVLLLLDNFEHVTSAAPAISSLLAEYCR